MSARKLQQEFDKINKKISEGLTDFDDTYEKLTLSDVGLQKEKLENDLKKEIKKLQRLRDQLKQWLLDLSIKLDKNLLQENRTKIERAMDLFKDLEKLLKIKQFSNEGLELQLQKQGRFTRPEDAKKGEACQYISDIIEQINQQNESLEGDIHQLTIQLKKAKLLQQSLLQISLDDEKYKVERNVTHLTKLEKILRNLENENLDPEKIEDIKDDLEYYVENNQEDDYVEYDDFYDALEMKDDIVDLVQGSLLTIQKEDEKKEEKEPEKEEPPTSSKPSPAKPEKKTVVSAIVTPKKQASAPPPPPATVTSTSTSVTPATDISTPTIGKAFVLMNPPPIASYTNLIKNAHAKAAPPGLKADPVAKASPATSRVSTPVQNIAKIAENGKGKPPVDVTKSNGGGFETDNKAPKPSVTTEVGAGVSEGKTFLDTIYRLSAIPQSRLENPLPFQLINPLLEQSLLNCPDSFDAEKPRQYHPVNTHPLLVDFPQEPMFELNSAVMMKKFDNDTLFFCFYYSSGVDSIARWNAAKELSNRGWVFNTELKQWFQVDEKLNKDKGNKDYKYFDYEKTWLTRRRENYDFGVEIQESFI